MPHATVKRLHKRDLESQVMIMLYHEGKKYNHDGVWRKYEALIQYRGENFEVKCEYVLRDVYLTYRDLTIERERKIILLN